MPETFDNWILSHESTLRFLMFAGVLFVMSSLETMWPRRERMRGRARRWFANIGVVVIASSLARVILPLFPVGAALWAEAQGYGAMNALAVPSAVAGFATIILLDLAIYAQHVVFHQVPVLWRLHRMHHTDVDLDATSGIRFHPVEIILSIAIKIALVIALGAPAWAVIVFEVMLNATSIFNHANLKLPLGLDRVLRLVIVTPDFHRVHHSVLMPETNSNYGFNLSVWDRVFGTYTPQPAGGHDGMTVGQDEFRGEIDQRLDKLLVQPFVGQRSAPNIHAKPPCENKQDSRP